MKRDIQNIEDDISLSKRIIETVLCNDPDIIEVIDNSELDPNTPDEYLYNNMIDNPTKFLKILSVFCGPNPRNNTLKELDLSKNKCKLSINDEFLKIIKNLQIDSLDISQNFELTNTADAEKFRKVASDVQNKIKIIFS